MQRLKSDESQTLVRCGRWVSPGYADAAQPPHTRAKSLRLATSVAPYAAFRRQREM